jgi:hypothetical protein
VFLPRLSFFNFVILRLLFENGKQSEQLRWRQGGSTLMGDDCSCVVGGLVVGGTGCRGITGSL